MESTKAARLAPAPATHTVYIPSSANVTLKANTLRASIARCVTVTETITKRSVKGGETAVTPAVVVVVVVTVLVDVVVVDVASTNSVPKAMPPSVVNSSMLVVVTGDGVVTVEVVAKKKKKKLQWATQRNYAKKVKQRPT